MLMRVAIGIHGSDIDSAIEVCFYVSVFLLLLSYIVLSIIQKTVYEVVGKISYVIIWNMEKFE